MATAAHPEESLTGVQKATIVLLSLGPELSAAILKRLPEEHVDAISHAMARMEKATPAQVDTVLTEFQTSLLSRGIDIFGGLDNVRAILTEAFGREQATRLVDRVSKSLAEDGTDFNGLRRVDPQQLAKFIQDEHPQTIAVILSHLDSSQAAALLCSLPAEARINIVTRMAALDRISPESVRTVSAVIRQKLRHLGELSRETCGGVRAVADMFNRLDANNCSELLDEINRENPVLFDNVRRFMFVFEDLAKLDKLALKEVLGRVDRKALLLALKGSSEELRRLFTDGMSQRGADMLKEDLDALGPVKIKEVDEAQQSIIMQARQLEAEGVISLKTSPGEQQYIQ